MCVCGQHSPRSHTGGVNESQAADRAVLLTKTE